MSASISMRVASPFLSLPQWFVLIDLTLITQHAFILNPIVLIVIAPRYVDSLVSENDPHQSPIWIKAEYILCLSAPGTLVPLTIIGAKPCPKSIHRICGSACAVQTRNSSRLGRNVKHNGRQWFPIRVTGFSTPLTGSPLSSKLNLETSAWPHTAFDVLTSSRELWRVFWRPRGAQ